ncbi:uncharacterized protein LOC6540754 [Drosophila erecta]|uniref:Uncharacterized protein n=1 Tax=Drosophila erecta TaxID=7220 RepID=B3NAU7_DROER|nr:uncharacterized protein LOC6540754 [Drosophila erecta]EDV58661.1 uncharacterized protein Dere_GG10193 [Drosophila erecta]
MPESNPKTLCRPSNGLDQAEESDVGLAANLVTQRNLRLHPRPQRQRPPRARRDATGFTANQEVRLKAGDMRMARLQISLSQLRTAMEESGKQLKDLCQKVRLNVDAE